MKPGVRDMRSARNPYAPVLRVSNLAVGHGKRPIVEHVSFDVNAGEVIALIGPNGSGKTTLLRTLAGQLEPIFGSIELYGRALEALHPSELACTIAAMFTERPRTELLTCKDVVELGRYPYTGRLGVLSCADRVEVQSAMEKVGIWDLRDRDFSHMSDGQRQRALIARALVQQTELLLLDEPTSYLDIRSQLDMLQLFRTHARANGVAVLVSLHEIDLAQKAADRIIGIREGRIWAQGTPEEVFTREQIEKLYDLLPQTFNETFGSVELPRPDGPARVFVMSGNGSGAACFRTLQRHDIPFAVGILHPHDVDCALARSLATRVVYRRPASPHDGESYQEALEVLRSCGALICLSSVPDQKDCIQAMLIHEAKASGLPVYRSAREYLDGTASS